MGYVFDILAFIFGWGAMLVLALCIASGLYLLSELAEDNSGPVRLLIKRGLAVLLVLHPVLYIDGIPFSNIVVSFGCNLCYLPLLNSFPFCEPISFPTLLGLAAVVVNHFQWLTWMYHDIHMDDYDETDVRSLVGFFLFFVWALPLGFFVSMTMMDEVLPAAGATGSSIGDPTRNGAFSGGGKRKVNVFKRIMDYIVPKERRDEFVDHVNPGRGKYV
mmetsp:Transcript_22532/g.27796  ORF Transcript_22532/g.27796 Transcript_22532/m.27796 type:complete len:217 (+) Transcript_22532:292-942(+)|eukprot:CAMPEP_0172517458 /NCGR_PEP_ID=MMETSP1066-20121228/285191_1 /TAXON_ID=671091 /ORGANISM="Coscinodiscus wailesii, Strain CCMP2513" /LENGTH=216 /DNA_ID=CAMNT_0013299467 /DNA_START=291 /DNA_END=941 /DNA_ORIENTATION=-